MGEKRQSVLRVSGELLRDHLFRTSPPDRWFRVSDGLPEDAEFVRLWVDEPTGDLCLVYSHPSFKQVYPGCRPEEVSPPLFHALTVTPGQLEFLSRPPVLTTSPLTDEQVERLKDDFQRVCNGQWMALPDKITVAAPFGPSYEPDCRTPPGEGDTPHVVGG